jgi:NAD(P)-dependent dehydrogenase (short-subunit alcohol dehydrogenase family)
MMAQLALVSGATGGIGSVVTRRLWQEGYSILALGHTSAKVTSLNDWFREHTRHNQDGFAMRIDLRNTEELWRISTLLDKTLSLLVVCHGAAPTPGPALHAAEALRTVIETDVYGAYELCALAGRYMIPQRHGSIVLLSSIHARQTYPERLPYCVAKSALSGIVKSLSTEWGKYGIRCNAILPWQTEGERTQSFITQAADGGEDLLETYKQKSPMRRLVTPSDIAETVVWLSQNSSITGQEIILDCGVSSSMWYKNFLELETPEGKAQ